MLDNVLCATVLCYVLHTSFHLVSILRYILFNRWENLRPKVEWVGSKYIQCNDLQIAWFNLNVVNWNRKQWVLFVVHLLNGEEYDFMCGEDNDVMYKNMYKAYDPLKVIFLRRSEKPNSLSFSLQVFVQQWGENNYVMNQWKYETWN